MIQYVGNDGTFGTLADKTIQNMLLAKDLDEQFRDRTRVRRHFGEPCSEFGVIYLEFQNAPPLESVVSLRECQEPLVRRLTGRIKKGARPAHAFRSFFGYYLSGLDPSSAGTHQRLPETPTHRATPALNSADGRLIIRRSIPRGSIARGHLHDFKGQMLSASISHSTGI